MEGSKERETRKREEETKKRLLSGRANILYMVESLAQLLTSAPIYL